MRCWRSRVFQQIGVMKAVGATPGQVMRVYLVMVLAYGLMAICMAVIPTPFLARALIDTMLSMANIKNSRHFRVTPGVSVATVRRVSGGPVIAALSVRVFGSAHHRPTGHLFLWSGDRLGGGPLDQLVARIRGLPRPLAISLRNTFRRQGRMALTQTTLVIAGVMFISVMGVRDSLMYTLERFFASRGFSVYFVLPESTTF